MAITPNAFAVTAGSQEIKWEKFQGTAIAGGEANGDTNSIAIGRASDLSVTDHNAKALAPGAISIGTRSIVKSRTGVALGYGTSVSGGTGSIALGTTSTANGETATAVGGNANATAKGAAALGAKTTASGEGTTAVGFLSKATAAGGTAIGMNTSAGTGIAIGRNASASNGHTDKASVAVGAGATANGELGTAIGTNAISERGETVALGANSFAGGQWQDHGVALGAKSKANHQDGVALGYGSETEQAKFSQNLSVKDDLGQNINSTNFAGVSVGGDPAYNNRTKVVSVGNETTKRQIINVAAGRVSEGSTDAINGSQLYQAMKHTGFNIQQNGTTKSRINNDGLVNFIDGNYTTSEITDGENSASVKVNVVTQNISTDAKGVTSVSGTSGLTTAKTVSDAINNALNNSSFLLKANDDTGEKITRNGSINITQGKNINIERNGSTITVKTVDNPKFTQVDVSNKLNVAAGGSLTVSGTSNLRGNILLGGEGKTITFQGSSSVDMGNNKITNVANGTAPKDAVNKSQLDAVNMIATTANNAANAANTTAINANNTAKAANETANTALDKINQGWNINTGKVEGGNVVGNDSTNVQMGDTVNVIAGKNLNITQSGKDIILSVNDSPSFTNVTTTNLTATNGTITNLNSTNGTFSNSLVSTGNTILSGNTNVGGEGKTFTVANGTKLDMGGNVISNITDGNISAGSKDAITGGQLHTTIQNITNSLTNQGMNFTGNNGEIIMRKLGETLTVQGSLAADKKADSSNIRTISNATTGAIEIVMAKDPTFRNLNAMGNATVGGDLSVNGTTTTKDLNVTDSAIIKDLNVTNNANIEKDLTVKGSSTVKGNATFEKDTLTKGNATVNGDSLVKGNSTVSGNLTVDKDLRVEGQTILQDVTIHQSLTLADNAKIDLGNSDIEGNFNIYGDSGKKTLSRALTQLQMEGPLVYVDPESGKDVQRRTDVVRLNSGSDKPVRVTNVADPKDASDAVNLGYFDKKLSLNMRDVHNRINRVDRRLRSGIASAVAMSLLPQSYRAGESIVSVGGGTYRGASAIAMGYSRVTDNGRVIIKIGGSANNSGDYAGGAAVGWKF
ncbi:hypothetical protein BKL51_06035 [Rodentibacter sp. Ppn85]|nr:hypothetical protein BKL51_06035 [Rodentibacter sp. Ppn85]